MNVFSASFNVLFAFIRFGIKRFDVESDSVITTILKFLLLEVALNE